MGVHVKRRTVVVGVHVKRRTVVVGVLVKRRTVVVGVHVKRRCVVGAVTLIYEKVQRVLLAHLRRSANGSSER